VDHALSCPKGGLPTLYYNEIRDLTATLLAEVCHQVELSLRFEPESNLQSIEIIVIKSKEATTPADILVSI